MNEPPLKENEIQLTQDYRISSDRHNLILQKRYQKREGKGKNAPLIDAYDYNDIGFYCNLKTLINGLVNHEIPLSIQQVSKIEDAHLRIEELKKEIQEYIGDKVVLKWYNPKLQNDDSGEVNG